MVFLIVVIVALAAAAYVCVEYLAEDHLAKKLSTSLDRTVRVDDVSYHFPRGIRIDGMHIDGLFETQRVYIYPNWRTVLKSIVEVQQVEMVGFKTSASEQVYGKEGETTEEGSIDLDEMTKKTSVLIKEIIVRSGKVEDLGGNQPLFHGTELTGIRAHFRDVYLPIRSTKIHFKVDAILQIPNASFNNSRVDAKGWINVIRNDMEGLLNVFNQQGINLLSAKVISQSNDVQVNGFINYQGEPGQQLGATPVESIGDLLLRSIADKNVHIGTKFAFETQLNKFRIGRVTFEGVVEQLESE